MECRGEETYVCMQTNEICYLSNPSIFTFSTETSAFRIETSNRSEEYSLIMCQTSARDNLPKRTGGKVVVI
jgi:hypothetical protein